MKFTTETETSRFSVKLSNGMRVTIVDHGEDVTIQVHEKERDLLNGAESDPDTPRYVQGGTYEFELPHVSDVAERCSEKRSEPSEQNFPAFGLASVEKVRHYH